MELAERLSALLELGLEPVGALPVSGEAVRVDRKTWKMAYVTPGMGTRVSITALSSSRDKIDEAVGRAFREMERLIQILTRFETTSPVSFLNQEGYLNGAPPELLAVLRRSLHFYQRSRGAFDISVLPILDLLGQQVGAEIRKPPSEQEVLEVLSRVGSEHLEVTGESVRFEREGMGITLDGIAKGYIVDRMADTLRGHGIRRYLIDAGGDIRAAGRNERKRPWTVAVQDPARRGEFPDIIELRDAAVATSGSYERFIDPGRTCHHIVESNSGRSPNVNTSVSVIAPTALAADALATGLFVMPARGGVDWIDAQRGCECLVIDENGTQHRSRRWKSAGVPEGGVS